MGSDIDKNAANARKLAEKYPDRPFFEFLAFTAPHFPLQAPAEDITDD